MSKYDALESIKVAWENERLSLGDKIRTISSEFSAGGLDLSATAAFLRVTPSELAVVLSLGDLDDEYIDALSRVNPPKTTWIMLANASDVEFDGALRAIERNRGASPSDRAKSPMTEYIYTTMVDLSGPTPEQKVANLSGDVLYHALKKGSDFKLLSDWDSKFLNNVAGQKKRGKSLSSKQSTQLIRILGNLANNGAISRNSIDGDQEICDAILDALDD